MTRKQEAIRAEEGFSSLDEIDFAHMDAVTGGCQACQNGAQPQQPQQKKSGQGAQIAQQAMQLIGGALAK